MKILLTGAKGQLGKCFQDRLPLEWILLATDSDKLDITNIDAIKETIDGFRPDAIVNAAAYTAVDKAETEMEAAWKVNVMGAYNLALAAKLADIKFVHISTDYVFDGTSRKPYCEDDTTNPLSVYGKTKRESEIAVLDTYPKSIIIRTAWVFSEYGNNFVKTMLKFGRIKKELNIVGDQYGCPTYAGDIALAIIKMLQADIAEGIFHFCGDQKVSWKEFCDVIFSVAKTENIVPNSPLITAITTNEYPTAAIRPPYSVLDCGKIMDYGVIPSDWFSALKYVIPKI